MGGLGQSPAANGLPGAHGGANPQAGMGGNGGMMGGGTPHRQLSGMSGEMPQSIDAPGPSPAQLQAQQQLTPALHRSFSGAGSSPCVGCGGRPQSLSSPAMGGGAPCTPGCPRSISAGGSEHPLSRQNSAGGVCANGGCAPNGAAAPTPQRMASQGAAAPQGGSAWEVR
eukprot:2438802-Prymnesium_polylepis.1